VKRLCDVFGRHTVIAAEEPQCARRKIDDREAASGSNGFRDLPGKLRVVGDVVKDRAHVHGIATSVGQVGRVESGLHDTHLWRPSLGYARGNGPLLIS
jgi:hypothetical protein